MLSRFSRVWVRTCFFFVGSFVGVGIGIWVAFLVFASIELRELDDAHSSAGVRSTSDLERDRAHAAREGCLRRTLLAYDRLARAMLSGKFATNALILTLGLFAYNALRLCGQEALRLDRDLPPTQRMPLRKKRHRRRLRNVIQDFIYMSGRVVLHARRRGLRLWSGNPWRAAWRAVYASFVTA